MFIVSLNRRLTGALLLRLRFRIVRVVRAVRGVRAGEAKLCARIEIVVLIAVPPWFDVPLVSRRLSAHLLCPGALVFKKFLMPVVAVSCLLQKA